MTTDFDPVVFEARLTEQFNTALNIALNGLAAKFAKQNAPPAEPPKLPPEPAPPKASTEPAPPAHPEPSNEQKITLKSLEAKLVEMNQQLAAAESRRQVAVMNSKLSVFSSKSVDSQSFETLFKAQHGENLVVDNDTVYVKSGANITSLEDAIATFNTTGGGQFLAPPTIEFSKGAAPKPGTETPTAPSEQQQLEHFLTAMRANS